ncbi:MAG: hypothetical protein Q4D10_08610 [Bacteroidales bacterium]|nr:hypothetical protein [Bacteroidales bacterium]
MIHYFSWSIGYYWSSSLGETYSDDAGDVNFGSEGVSMSNFNRSYGFSVRPVSE